MSDTEAPRRPGPWDPKPGDNAPAPSAPAARPAEPPLDKGQHPVWAIVSTLLLGGLIWYWTQSWIVVSAVLFGLLVHEYGHVLAMNRLGMGPARIYIIPFLGGLAKGQREPASEWHGVLVSLAGPVFGLLAAIPFFVLYLWSGQPAWLQGVFVIAMLNLINLAPAPPLDGSKALGPVLARIHPLLEWIVLLLIGGAVVLWGVSMGSWFFSAFLAIALFAHLRRGAWRPEGRRLTWGEAGRSTALFLGALLLCIAVAVAGVMPIAGSAGDAASTGASFLGLDR